MQKEKYQQYISYLDKYLQNPPLIKGFLGFDGFVDEIIDVVEVREDVRNYRRFITIDKFNQRVKTASGKSINLELVSRQTKLGGNGPIMANSMANHGLDMSYIGNLNNDYDQLHKVFLPMKEKMNIYSIGRVAHTDALEFTDGKLMLGKLCNINKITWESIIHSIGEDTLNELITQSNFMGFVNWTMIPFMNDIWEKFIEKFHVLEVGKFSHVFIDLADFAKRISSDCLRAVDLMRQMSKVVYVTLGMNLKEAVQLGQLLDVRLKDESEREIIRFTEKLFEKLELDALAVHPREYAVAITKNGTAIGKGAFTNTPKISTGAGDHFNAGYFTGKLIGMPHFMAVINGVLNSGFYIRTAVSPTLYDLREFARLWYEGKEELIRQMYTND